MGRGAFIYGIVLIIVCSCAGLDDNIHTADVFRIDSLVVRSTKIVNLSSLDTVAIDVEVFPYTASLSDRMIKERQIRLEKLLSGGGRNEPSEYSLIKLEKAIGSSTDKHNIFRLYLADNDAGYGYRDSTVICLNSETYTIPVSSGSIVICNTGTQISGFSISDGINTCRHFQIKNDTIHIQVPNTFELEKAVVSFKHNGSGVYLNGEKQQSGSLKDFTDFCHPLEYVVKGFDGEEQKYTIEVFNLPILYINTPDRVDITSRYEWLANCSFTIRDTDGNIEDYGAANVKGRGNWSWRVGLITGKKPLAVKLEKKPKDRTVLGMPGHKRWVLLANPLDYLPNPLGFEVTRRAESNKWAPRSRYVELILNGELKGLYLLCEQIKIDKNRVDITELKKTDVEGDAVTGGYLISYDDADEDDDPRFYTEYYKMPVMIKNPDADEIQPEQLDFITSYINDMENSIYNDVRFSNHEYEQYIDVDSWIDYYFVEELWGSYEMWRPRSVWMSKDRGGKICAGPGWDFEQSYFVRKELLCKKGLYFNRLFEDSKFVSRMKERWYTFKSNLQGNDKYGHIYSYVDSLYKTCHFSAYRDRMLYPSMPNQFLPSKESTIDLEYNEIKSGMNDKIAWMEEQIMSW